ncbi:MAG: sodium:solute symporter family protein [Bacteroidota bacterium]
MQYNISINQAGVAIFVLLNLVVGMWAGRRVKTMGDYALANQSLGSGTLTMTLIATFIECSYIMAIHTGYKMGLLNLLFPAVGVIIAMLVLGWYIYPRLRSFKEAYTMGDVMGQCYGPKARLITAIITVLFCIVIVSNQLIGISHIVKYIGINPLWGVILIGSIITLYTFTGGVRSVAATDVLQFIILAVGVVAVVNTGVRSEQIGGISKLIKTVYQEYPSYIYFWQHDFFSYQILATFFWGLWPTLLVSPPIIQRALMTRKKEELAPAFTSLAIFYFLFRFMIFILGIMVLKVVHEGGEGPSLSNVIDFLFERILDNQFVSLCFILAFISVVMSTADSYLNSTVVTIQHDLVSRYLASKKQEDSSFMQSTRIIALCLGIICIVIASYYLKTPTFYFTSFSLSMLSSLCLPFLAALLGLRTAEKTFLTYIFVFFVTLITAMLLDIYAGISLHTSLIPVPEHLRIVGIATNSWVIATTLSSATFFLLRSFEQKHT